ncbi:hypothetical protein NP493_1417g00040 [Ridgeia piscesae]|uniref:Galaxin-like repeats domain-containing protein n=1 Tax=Ridgeia piscesae TaxID=27915 RepID=A0AAD9NBY8_RIDPI|nr:hypothetical protein NP493_1417g00040 [Ridgeia piscesae]
MSIAVCIHAGNTCPPRLTGNANPVTTGHKSSCVASPMLQSSSLRRTLETSSIFSPPQRLTSSGLLTTPTSPTPTRPNPSPSPGNNRAAQNPFDKSEVAVCGMELYLPRTHVCCGRRQVAPKINEYTECCGRFRYDSRFMFCCGKFLGVGEDARCCEGRAVYNARSQICCSGKVIKKKDKDEYCCGNKVCKGMWL